VEHDVAMYSGAMMHIPSFIEIGLAIQKLIGEGWGHTQTTWISHKRTLNFQNKDSRLKR
jgi:hypothetical protein